MSKKTIVMVILTVTVAVIAIIVGINDASRKKSYTNANISSKKYYLEALFADSSAEFIEEYKGYYIYKLSLQEDIYFIGFEPYNYKSISKNNINILDYEGDKRTIYTNKSETAFRVYEKESDGKEDYILTLFNEKNELKDTIDNNS